jgi:hypothetical protein
LEAGNPQDTSIKESDRPDPMDSQWVASNTSFFLLLRCSVFLAERAGILDHKEPQQQNEVEN